MLRVPRGGLPRGWQAPSSRNLLNEAEDAVPFGGASSASWSCPMMCLVGLGTARMELEVSNNRHLTNFSDIRAVRRGVVGVLEGPDDALDTTGIELSVTTYPRI